MELVIVPDSKTPRALPFYLSLEEWLARKYPGRDFFFMWQVEPTVIVGRHQLIEREVDTQFCHSRGIDLVRRKSGGGAVLADMNNIMFSYITSSSNVTTTFSEYTSMVARSLRLLGLDASDNSRNDILIGDRKVSGNSYYHIKGRSIVHGTMLYDFDPEMMAGALTPPAVKLQSHGVSSVRSRVTTIREQLPSLSMADFKAHILRTIPDQDRSLILSPSDLAKVEEIEKTYRRPEWLTGQNPKGTLTLTQRIEGVGTISVCLTVTSGKIKECSLSGDYLSTAENISETIAERLLDTPYERTALTASLASLELSSLIPGLKNEDFIKLIC